MNIQRTLVLFLMFVFISLSLYLRLGNVSPDDFVDYKAIEVNPTWHTYSTNELIRHSDKAFKQGDIKLAEGLAIKAWRQNVTSGKAAAQLLTIYTALNDIEKSDTVAGLASTLWPANTPVRFKLANYWAKRNNLAKALPEWDALMIRNPASRKRLFPVFSQIVNHPETFSFLIPFMNNPPNWWSSFFAYLTRSNESIEPLKNIYATRTASQIPLESIERRSFVNRLIKEKQYTEAYFAWLGGLHPNQLSLSGLVYDGGFEGDTFSTGFDWHFSRATGLKTQTSTTNGVNGAKALRVTLNNKKLRFRHISQRLNLSPGRYTLSGKYRVNRLRASKGLSWRVFCTSDKQTQIAESIEFKGRIPWNEFETEKFLVPSSGCKTQLLRLEATSPYTHHHSFKGTIWFDDITIKRQQTNNDQ